MPVPSFNSPSLLLFLKVIRSIATLFLFFGVDVYSIVLVFGRYVIVSWSMMSGFEARDPFTDPIPDSSQHELEQNATLIVNRNASLTLGTDSLIVLGERNQCATRAILTRCADEGFISSENRYCCGFPSRGILRTLITGAMLTEL